MKITYDYSLEANIHELVNGSDVTNVSILNDNVIAGNITSAFDKVSKIMDTINSKSDVKYHIASISKDGNFDDCANSNDNDEEVK